MLIQFRLSVRAYSLRLFELSVGLHAVLELLLIHAIVGDAILRLNEQDERRLAAHPIVLDIEILNAMLLASGLLA